MPRVLAVVFLLVAAVNSAIAALNAVAWPAVVAVCCTAVAIGLDRLYLSTRSTADGSTGNAPTDAVMWLCTNRDPLGHNHIDDKAG
ncbi:hypothetical protein ACIA8G_21780 [Lentzea sp. NPDC051213]|uniref:hypothetical protein n=1 Tax=Lentzea sp. NPDC051213 TaxID=3364126 RepID=UPI003796C011